MTNKIETLVCLALSADKVTIDGRRYIAKAAIEADKELLTVKKALRLQEAMLKRIRGAFACEIGNKSYRKLLRQEIDAALNYAALPVS